jgi:hypothetical protein
MGETIIGEFGIPRPKRISVIRSRNSYTDLLATSICADTARPLQLRLNRESSRSSLLRNIAKILESID